MEAHGSISRLNLAAAGGQSSCSRQSDDRLILYIVLAAEHCSYDTPCITVTYQVLVATC